VRGGKCTSSSTERGEGLVGMVARMTMTMVMMKMIGRREL